MAASSTTVPANIATSAEPHDAARIGVRAEPRDPGGRDQQRYRERQEPHPGVDRREPERDRQEQRHDEEDARLDEVLEEEHPQAADQLRVLQHRRPHQRLGAALLEPRLPLEEQPQQEQAAEDQPQRQRRCRTAPARRAWARPSPRRSSAAPRTPRGPGRPPRARRRRGRCAGAPRAARPRSRRVSTRIAEHDQHLAGEHQAPAEVGGEQPADERPDGDRDRAGGHHQAVGARPALGGEVGGDQRDDRRQDQRGADAFEERPAR